MTLVGDQRIPFTPRIDVAGELTDAPFAGLTWNFRNYQRAVLRHLAELRDSQVGEIVMDAIARRVVIVPRRTRDGNAVARPVANAGVSYRMNDVPISTWMGHTASMMRGVRSDPRSAFLGPMSHFDLGTGEGSDTVIEFTPAFHDRGSALGVSNALTGRGTETLLHELVHAVMQTRGREDPTATTGDAAPFENRAEFNAIMVTNIYRSEQDPQADLRASHDISVYKILPHPETFYDDNRTLVAAFCAKVPDMARRLARVRGTSFNPCRQHFAGPNG